MLCVLAVLEGRVVGESDLLPDGLQFPDASSLRDTAWQNTTSHARLPRITALQLLRAQNGRGLTF